MIVLYEWMLKIINIKKAWHNATKPLNLYSVFNSAFNLKGFSREVPRPSEPFVFS
jgi:hypothetical protein